MRPKIVAGNWKMNGSSADITSLIHSLQKELPPASDNVKMAVFPPFVYLPLVQQLLEETSIEFGAQNLAQHAKGAFTGEISASMLADIGCRYVLIGHSERRTLYGETLEMTAQKMHLAVEAGLTPIVCVGESRADREATRTMAVIIEQLDAILNTQKDGIELFSNAMIAYEPVWAIGTGLVATPAQVQQVHTAIRMYLAQKNKLLAEALPILYGGSVKADNASTLVATPHVDGFLVGGASLDARDFASIVEAAGSV